MMVSVEIVQKVLFVSLEVNYALHSQPKGGFYDHHKFLSFINAYTNLTKDRLNTSSALDCSTRICVVILVYGTFSFATI